MAKFHDHHLIDDPGIDLDSQDLHPADLSHGDFVSEQEPDSAPSESAPEEDAQPLLAFLSNQKKLAPNDIRHVLSPPKSTSKTKAQNVAKHTIILDGVTYKQAMHHVNYKVSAHSSAKAATLIDHGANGGMAGSDVRLLETGRDLLMSVVLMTISSATCLFALWLVLCRLNMALLLQLFTKWHIMERGALSSLADKWKPTRSRWMTDLFMLVESRELRLWKGISSLYNAEVACLTLKCSHPLTRSWMNFPMLSSLLTKIGILPLLTMNILPMA